MVNNGDGKILADDSLIKPGSSIQNPNCSGVQTIQRSDMEKNFMETEGRGYSDFLRNSSEEIFLKSLIESSIGMPTPTMEMLGFKNLSQSFRADSEELFNSWLTNGESHGQNPTSIAQRTRQASRRISTELSAFASQQHGIPLQKNSNDNFFQQNLAMVDELSSDHNQGSLRNVVERGMQASNMYLAKAWFHSSQPMTRSRSSELRKRYAAMQNFQTSNGMEATHKALDHGLTRMKQEFSTTNSFGDVSEVPNQLRTFLSPSNSSTSPFSSPQIGIIDTVSSVVSMLKGTLERKKLSNHIEKETVEGSSSFALYGAQDGLPGMTLDQGPVNHILESPATYQALSAIQVKDSGTSQALDGSIEIDMNGFVAPAIPIQVSTISQEPSQSESSAAAPVPSTGFEVCDGPTYSGQTPSGCESSRKRIGNGNLENSSTSKDFRERIFENNFKEDRKKGSLVRMGSVTSGGSVDKGDPTKKRRVERSRKMAEAKERNLTPTVPSDMQAILKRCENLEKEVRSLKLNLSFMNRKDSEQTKQIEELQKQNDDLADEKERLLEEIERILSGSGKM